MRHLVLFLAGCQSGLAALNLDTDADPAASAGDPADAEGAGDSQEPPGDDAPPDDDGVDSEDPPVDSDDSTAWFDTDSGLSSGTPCVDDPDEPNDTVNGARPRTSGAGLVVSDSSFDYWSFDLEDGDVATVTLNFLHQDGDIDLWLWDDWGSSVAYSNGIADYESAQIQHWGPRATYYAEVRQVTPGACPSYDYEVVVNAGPCADDGYEANNDINNASALTAAQDLVIVQGDEDWFSFEVPAYATAKVDLSFDHSLGDVDLFLYDQDGWIADQDTWQNDNASAEDTNLLPSTETWYARVKLFGFSKDCNSYDYQVTLR